MKAPSNLLPAWIRCFLLALGATVRLLLADDGTERGWLLIHGGGRVSQPIHERFLKLAGGPDATLVVIPTAAGGTIKDASVKSSAAKAFGFRRVLMLHTRLRAEADTDAFVEPLRHASAVWISGGEQWRLCASYLGTRTEAELKNLLRRGGVVGGSSAGATIQGSFLVRGAPGTWYNPDGDDTIMMAPGHTSGFALLPDTAIDQHIDTRNRFNDLNPVVDAHPELLGIGLEEGMAILVHGHTFSVLGKQVAIHDGKLHDGRGYYFLSDGDAFDLATRTKLPPRPND